MTLQDFEPKSKSWKRGSDPKINARLRLGTPAYVKDTTSKAPQVIVKIANNSTTGGGVKNTMEYLARTKDGEKALEMEDQDGNTIGADKESIKAIYDEWSQKFETEPDWKIEANEKYKEWKRENPELKDKEYEGKIPRMKRQVTHMILSGKVGESDQDAAKLLASARETVQREIGDKGHDYVMVMHRDTENPHVHVLINNYNREMDRPKLRINKPELFSIRQELAGGLKERGIEVAATLRKDRPEKLKDIEKGIERVHQKETWFKSKMEKKAGSMDAFKHRKYQLRTIQVLEQKVKDSTIPLTGERKEYLKSLSDLKKGMIKEDTQSLDKKVMATVNKLTADHKELGKHLEDLKKYEKPMEKRMDKINRSKIISKYSEGIQKDVKSAMVDIKKNKSIPSKEKKEALSILKTTDKQLERMNKQISRG